MDSKPKPTGTSEQPDLPNGQDAPSQDRKHGLFSRFNRRFQDALETSRGTEALAPASGIQGDDLALRRAKTSVSRRLVIPEGTTVRGSLACGGDAEIGGRVEGDVIAEGRLYLLPTAHIAGNVRAAQCRNEGIVEGKTASSQDVDVQGTGRCNGDVAAGSRIAVAGQVLGNVSVNGIVQLAAASRVEGNIHARRLVIEEGATFNGHCKMRPETTA